MCYNYSIICNRRFKMSVRSAIATGMGAQESAAPLILPPTPPSFYPLRCSTACGAVIKHDLSVILSYFLYNVPPPLRSIVIDFAVDSYEEERGRKENLRERFTWLSDPKNAKACQPFYQIFLSMELCRSAIYGIKIPLPVNDVDRFSLVVARVNSLYPKTLNNRYVNYVKDTQSKSFLRELLPFWTPRAYVQNLVIDFDPY